jgi:hypothetical protein
VPEPTATWNGARGVWEKLETSILCGHPVPFSETWPTSGMTRSGSLYPRATPGRPTSASACSLSPGLLPTPTTSTGRNARHGDTSRGDDLPEAVKYLPTPQAADARRGAESEMGGLRPSGAKRSDGLKTALLKTPTAQLAVNGGSQHPDKRREGGHGPTLADQVEHLLPTPRVTCRAGMEPSPSTLAGRHGADLGPAIGALLPTPDATHGRKTTRTSLLLPGVVEQLLPTPRAADGGPRGSGAGGLRNTTREISRGETTNPPSADGKPSSDGQLPGQLSLDGLESG